MVGKGAKPRQVRIVADGLRRLYDGRFDLSFFDRRSDFEREQAFLSRALAAQTVRQLIGCSYEDAARCVIDGSNDMGIDAVAVDPTSSHLFLIQSKWSDQARARFGRAEALALVDGLRAIDNREFDRFNDLFQPLAESVRSVLHIGGRTTLVIVAARTEKLSADVIQVLDDARQEFNSIAPGLDHRAMLMPEIWQAVSDDFTDSRVDLTIQMEQSLPRAKPLTAYYGTVPVSEVAQWHDDHGDRLFGQNIRGSLGLTGTNQAIVETLENDPQTFWYLNNGITVLCDSINAIPFSQHKPSGPITLQLQGASIVNGAQTVTSVHEAQRRGADISEAGDVLVRVIVAANTDDAVRITRATNTQNRVEARDFVAQRPEQTEIARAFRIALDKTYAVKRRDLDPPRESGCSVVHAAMALTCAHPDPELAARVKGSHALLWEEGSRGIYDQIFQPTPSPYQIWRSVQVMWAVQQQLQKEISTRRGRAQTIAEAGELLLTHLVFQCIDPEELDSSDTSDEDLLCRVPDLTTTALTWLIHHMDNSLGSPVIGNTFTNAERCRLLADKVTADMQQPTPTLPAEYSAPAKPRRPRRPNAVSTLIDHAAVAEGTVLTFQVGGDAERAAMETWLAADARRNRVTWRNQRSKPLLWSADGKAYSPSGLVAHMWELAEWKKAPVAVQGPKRWMIPGQGTIDEVARRLIRQDEADTVPGAQTLI